MLKTHVYPTLHVSATSLHTVTWECSPRSVDWMIVPPVSFWIAKLPTTMWSMPRWCVFEQSSSFKRTSNTNHRVLSGWVQVGLKEAPGSPNKRQFIFRKSFEYSTNSSEIPIFLVELTPLLYTKGFPVRNCLTWESKIRSKFQLENVISSSEASLLLHENREWNFSKILTWSLKLAANYFL